MEEIYNYRMYFDECDIDKDGSIDIKEFDLLLKQLNVPTEEIEKAVIIK